MFRTPVMPVKSTEKIKLDQSLLLTGSCFSEHIGQKLHDYKFNSLTNPFGVTYNPISIFKLLQQALEQKPVERSHIIKNQGIYRHYDFHSDISALNEDDLIVNIKKAYQLCSQYIRQSEWIIITFGTAMVYRHKQLNDIVGNCHKIPAKEFERELLKPETILNAFKTFYETLKKNKAGFNIIITVSPVRHLKDTLELNSLSKSILRMVCARLSEAYDNVQYFPAYEIMMDDLRDYRFYDADMLHPNDQAINYIWEVFQKSYFSDETIHFIRKWETIRNALQHRPFYPESEEHQRFIRNTIQQLKVLSTKVDIKAELDILEKQLK